MSLENGTVHSAGDAVSSTHKQQLGEYPVKEAFAQNGHSSRTRKMLVRRRKQKVESPLGTVCAWVVKHQIGLSVNLLLLLALTHIFLPRARQQTRKFFVMSYYDAAEDHYTQGWHDVYFVFFWIVIFTGVRVAVMDHVLTPFAQWSGIASKKGRVRFAEQGWVFLYDSTFWTLGMYIMYTSDYWLNLEEMWTNFPKHSMGGLMKWYYLVQFAFWLQQLFVVNVEDRRKDHWQMFTHHIFTIALMFTSYGFYQTKVGNVILCTMDIVDILLPLAKMLNYLGLRTLCDIAFGVFITTWFLTRHVAYNLVCWSIYSDVPKVMPYGCFDSKTGKQISKDGGSSIWENVMQPFNNPDGGIVCFNNNIRMSFLCLLLAIQVLTLIWFGMILRVAYGVLCGKGSQDVRSDDEGEDELEEEEVEVEIPYHEIPSENAKAQPIEEEVDAESLNHKRRKNGAPIPVRRSSRRAGNRTTAISIPGHSDPKELLNRIGCDKPS